MNFRPLLAVLALSALGLPAAGVRAEAVQLVGERQTVVINLNGGLPARWIACAEVCSADATSPRAMLLDVTGDNGQLRWTVPGDEEATRRLDGLQYVAEAVPSAATPTVILTSREPFQGIRLVHRFRLDTRGHTLDASVQIPGGARLVLTGGATLVPEKLAGFGSIYSDARAVLVNAEGQRNLSEPDKPPVKDMGVAAGEWTGVRGRFWTVLLKPDGDVTVSAGEPQPERPELVLSRGDGGGSLELTLYGGPVERRALTAAAPELSRMLYAGLWDWLRAGSLGLGWILDRWQAWVGNWGIAIMLLSLTVKLLMWPLTWIAERWQADVNRIQSLLQPELAAIKREFKGEEAHQRVLAVYQRHGVSPWFTLKSLAGFLIQIPVFIAAFDMLGEHFGLAGQSFLWVRDLSLPDRVAALPTVLPFFGGHLNLMPFIMTALTIAAARLQEEASLAPVLRIQQRLRLYAMAAVFFVLLYTFPAGMVLYWTTNNLLHLVRILAGRVMTRSSSGGADTRTTPSPSP